MSYIKTKDGVFEVATISDEPIIDFDGKPDYDDTRAVYVTTNQIFKHYYGNEIIEEKDDLFKIVDVWFWKESFIEFFVDNIRFTFAGDDYIFFLDETIINDGVYGAVWMKDENGVPYLKTICKMVDLLKVELI